MEIPLRIQLLLWWTILFRGGKKEQSIVTIKKKGRGAANILFLLPSEKEHARIAAHFVKRDLDDYSRQIRYVVHKDGLQFYSKQLKPNMITFDDEDLNWLGGLKSESVLDRIKSLDYDALVDLNQSEDQTLSLVTMELDIPIKIGFQSPFADKLYTLVIQRSPRGFLEHNYETIERLLGLA